MKECKILNRYYKSLKTNDFYVQYKDTNYNWITYYETKAEDMGYGVSCMVCEDILIALNQLVISGYRFIGVRYTSVKD